MGIFINKRYNDPKVLSEHMRKCHNALAGSPAYISGEIAIVQEDPNSFTLCIGNDFLDGNNVRFIINSQKKLNFNTFQKNDL